MKQSDYATAYHEAGHAFADWKFGFKLKRASIVPNQKDGSAGHVLTRPGLHFKSLEYSTPSGARIGRLHERIVSLMAGQTAQRKYKPTSIRSYHGQSDRDAIAKLVFTLHAPNVARLVIRYLEAVAKNLIENPVNWFVIKYIARELLNRKSMTGDDLQAVIYQAYKNQNRAGFIHRRRRRTPTR